jgi:hypothetical protein
MKYLEVYSKALNWLWSSKNCGLWTFQMPQYSPQKHFCFQTSHLLNMFLQEFPWLRIIRLELIMQEDYENVSPNCDARNVEFLDWLRNIPVTDEEIQNLIVSFEIEIDLLNLELKKVSSFVYDTPAMLTFTRDGQEMITAELSITPDFFSQRVTERAIKQPEESGAELLSTTAELLKSNREELRSSLLNWEKRIHGKIISYSSQTNFGVYEYGFQD